MNDPELDAVRVSLDESWWELRDLLVVAAGYLESLAEGGDERAAFLSGRIEAAFDAMEAESIGAADLLADREYRR